jgi:hypothetical protein
LEEVTRGWRRLHSEKLRDLYASPNFIMVIKLSRTRLAGHVARTEGIRNVYKTSVGKYEWKRPPRKLRRRWEDNIRKDLRERRYKAVD